jgi:hypothetical protein
MAINGRRARHAEKMTQEDLAEAIPVLGQGTWHMAEDPRRRDSPAWRCPAAHPPDSFRTGRTPVTEGVGHKPPRRPRRRLAGTPDALFAAAVSEILPALDALGGLSRSAGRVLLALGTLLALIEPGSARAKDAQ